MEFVWKHNKIVRHFSGTTLVCEWYFIGIIQKYFWQYNLHETIFLFQKWRYFKIVVTISLWMWRWFVWDLKVTNKSCLFFTCLFGVTKFIFRLLFLQHYLRIHPYFDSYDSYLIGKWFHDIWDDSDHNEFLQYHYPVTNPSPNSN